MNPFRVESFVRECKENWEDSDWEDRALGCMTVFIGACMVFLVGLIVWLIVMAITGNLH